ncbi:MAG: hypothetical protein BV458_03865, partial [Thermoplasmata archaeon M9B2D]
MKGKLLIVAIAAFLLFSGVVAAVGEQAGNSQCQVEKNQYQSAPTGDGMMQRLMYQIRDMLGICKGGANLSELTGVMTYDGTNFYIESVELHFGPIWYITTATSAVDYDEDGELELVIDELFGLVNTTVTVEGHYQADDWMSVFTINGEVYREPGQPIWAA